MPIADGESIVIRILDKAKSKISFLSLGMSSKNLQILKKTINLPYGILFVTGPTGSGKTTTLYAAINAIKSIQKKIITIEDPIEYKLSLTQQIQINRRVNLSFINALRSILRQDPDVIMIGEVRDEETLKMAVQSSLTGHLVLSTLHTNDALSAIERIQNMGIENYLIGSSIVAIQAQRLIRKLCCFCKNALSPTDKMLEAIKEYQIDDVPKVMYEPKGCPKCLKTGYLGREMISEILFIDKEISSLILSNANKEQLKAVVKKNGFRSMFEDGIIKAIDGVTSIQEIFRVAKSI